jgi:hypothetical protein
MNDDNEPLVYFYYDGESPFPDKYTTQEWEWIKRIEAFLGANPQAEWGPGHVVLSDYNFQSIDFCLEECEKLITGEKPFSECPTVSWDDVIQTKKFLLKMKAALYE